MLPLPLHKQITDELQQQKTLAIQEKDKARVEQMELIKEMKKSNRLIVDLTDRARSDRLTIDVLTNKTENLEAKVTAMPKLMLLLQKYYLCLRVSEGLLSNYNSKVHLIGIQQNA